MYDRTRGEGFGAEVKRRIMLGTYVLSAGYYDAYYLKAQQVRTLIRRDYERGVRARRRRSRCRRARRRRSGSARSIDDPLQMYLADVFTVSANLAGLPAISVPCGFTARRLPVGLQLTGRAFDEATLLRVAGGLRATRPTGTSGARFLNAPVCADGALRPDRGCRTGARFRASRAGSGARGTRRAPRAESAGWPGCGAEDHGDRRDEQTEQDKRHGQQRP